MTSATPSARRHRALLVTAWLPLWIVATLCLVTTSGCRGCIGSSESEKLSREELEKKAREQREALVTSPLQTLPSDIEVKIATVKPGHWVETIRQVKSNREDLQVIASGSVLRGNDKVLNIPSTNIVAEFTRPTVLPKGQTKTIDLQYFIPTTTIAVDPINPVSTALRLRSSLLSRSLLTPITEEPFSAAEMGYGEFLLTVLSPKPQDYAFLSAMDVVLWRGSDLMLEDRIRSYRVVLCGSKDGKVDFPTSLLTMTSMAVLIWDDLAPDDLSQDQKTALVDWLHWGGQLVVSGPSSWSRLQNSFLSPFLPIRGGETTEMGTEELAPLNHWVVSDRSGQAADPIMIVGTKMPGLTMQLNDGAQWLPESGQLVAERMLGRGRVVVTGFPLREQRLYRWKYYSSFISTGILRRPARKVSQLAGEESIKQIWAPPFSDQEGNPLFNSQLRIASRDMPLANSSDAATNFANRTKMELERRKRMLNPATPDNELPPQLKTFDEKQPEGVQWAPNGAAWSDTSGFTFAALETLRKAAGIVLPSRATIALLIGSYLLILVPLNWLVFRLLGRLEWAWIAAPIVALVGVVVVTRVARLDIGFARRTTEIGLLELQGEYPRAHLTNYTALYTSLSTNYALEYPDPGSVALPLGDVSLQSTRRSNLGSRIMQAKYGTSAGMRLEPVTVFSNSTEMLHSEQMVKLTGGILFGSPTDKSVAPDSATPSDAETAASPASQPAVIDTVSDTVAIKNTTGIELKSCCLLRLGPQGMQYAWIGDMVDSNSRTAKFETNTADSLWKNWNLNPVTRHPTYEPDEAGASPTANSTGDDKEKVAANELPMGRLLSELVVSVPLVAGQVRLLGYTDQRPGKMESTPADGRLDTRTVVLAHLRPAKWREVTRDLQIIGRPTAPIEPAESTLDASQEPPAP